MINWQLKKPRKKKKGLVSISDDEHQAIGQFMSNPNFPKHVGYDDIIPVVEKIEALGFNVHIVQSDVVIKHVTTYATIVKARHFGLEGENKLHSIVMASIKFTKSYSTNSLE